MSNNTFPPQPSLWVAPHETATCLNVDPNDQNVWESWKPPRPADRPHSDHDIQFRAVAEECCENHLEAEGESQGLVGHPLLEDRVKVFKSFSFGFGFQYHNSRKVLPRAKY